jgi:hypothetical protein
MAQPTAYENALWRSERARLGKTDGKAASMAERLKTLGELVRWLDMAPAGTVLDAAQVRALLAEAAEAAAPQAAPSLAADPSPQTWRERLWLVPAETRMGVREVAEALNRTPSYVYRRTGPSAAEADRLPCRRLDGELVFVAGELRGWLRAHEEVVAEGEMESTAAERRGLLRAG